MSGPRPVAGAPSSTCCPGLTHAERRAALLRARRSAGLGHGPRLPAAGVAAAVARDRVAATARNGAAAFRAHPLLLLPPVLIAASATLVYVMLSAVSITFPPGPRRPGPAAAGHVPARPGRRRGGGRGGVAAGRGTARRGSGAPGARPSPSPAPASGQPGSGSRSRPGSRPGIPSAGTPTTGPPPPGPRPPRSAPVSPSPSPSTACNPACRPVPEVGIGLRQHRPVTSCRPAAAGLDSRP